MALDFPSNPVDGEIFDAYIWNASKGVWQAKEESATVAVMSPTKPLTANAGDIWVNTTTGIAFAYYDDGNTSQWMELLSSAVPSINEVMPYGTIVQTARTTAPSGWLLCQGQNVSRTTYAGLFAAIGTTYGAGDGSTTFGIPNLQGRVPVGLDSTQTEFDVLGETSGAKTHTLTIDQMPSHTHVQNSHNHTQDPHQHNILYYSPAPVPTGVSDNGWVHPVRNSPYQSGGVISNTTATNQATTATNQNTGGGLAHNNLQPYIVLNYMIKV